MLYAFRLQGFYSVPLYMQNQMPRVLISKIMSSSCPVPKEFWYFACNSIQITYLHNCLSTAVVNAKSYAYDNKCDLLCCFCEV